MIKYRDDPRADFVEQVKSDTHHGGDDGVFHYFVVHVSFLQQEKKNPPINYSQVEAKISLIVYDNLSDRLEDLVVDVSERVMALC